MPRFGSLRELERDYDLHELVLFHQQLDLEAEGQRLAYQLQRNR